MRETFKEWQQLTEDGGEYDIGLELYKAVMELTYIKNGLEEFAERTNEQFIADYVEKLSEQIKNLEDLRRAIDRGA